jgi:hypothetical protein
VTGDPTRQRDQPALTTSSGLIWLVVGGIMAAISGGVLIALGAWPAAVVIAALYLGMLLVRFAAPPGRVRLGLLAVLTLAIAGIALISVMVLAAGAAL